MNATESVTKFMATRLITFTPDVDIRDAIQTIVKNKISGAPVLNETGDLIGILSENDCLRVILEGPYNNQPGGSGFVRDYMTTEVKVIDANWTIMDAAYAFTQSNFGRFPVVENGKLVGQISRRDILTAIMKIRPKINIIPDSWKGREPMIHPSKQGRFTKNA